VRVPAERERNAKPCGFRKLPRLVREQHQGARRIAALQCRGEVRRAGRILDARDVEPGRDLHALVAQRADAERRQVRVPFLHARVVLVIAGDEVHAAGRMDPRQGSHVLAQLVHAPVDQVTGDGDQVR